MALDINNGPHRIDHLKEEIVARQAEVNELTKQVAALTEQLDREQKLNGAARQELSAEIASLAAENASLKAAAAK